LPATSFTSTPCGALLQIRGIRIPVNRCHHPLATQQFGTNTVGKEITVTVPAGTGSMSIYSQGVAVPIVSVTLTPTSGAPFKVPNSVVPTLVKDPLGTLLFDDLPPPPADGSGLPIFYGGVSPFTGTMTVPNTSFLLEHTALQGGLSPGPWKFTVNDFAQECTQVRNCTGGGATSSYDVRVYLAPPEELRRKWKVQRDCSRKVSSN